MSEELRNSDACSGDCAGCGGDCTSFDSEKQTITLTLDDDSQLECRVINILADVFENLMSQAGFLEPEEQEGESAQE